MLSSFSIDGFLRHQEQRPVFMKRTWRWHQIPHNIAPSNPGYEIEAPVSKSEHAVLAVNQIKRDIKDALLELSAQQGPLAALLPGSFEKKSTIDSFLRQLTQQQALESIESAIPKAVPQLDTRILGKWELVYTSNGTVVTRTLLVQILSSLSSMLPGVGISDIRQTLTPRRPGAFSTINEATLGLGLLGSWKLAIEGGWFQQDGDDAVKVVFERLSVKPVGLQGQPLPDWLPQVTWDSNVNGVNRAGASWVTTYVDDDVRLGMGPSSKNIFLFYRR
ncbi:hypothetical protein CEUSTIGMA_g5584.t1 [Chlamydomonas eustigma]|uniref:Uncharacterized protein n=1 Tax=Chlamydomonas eustigma TaxID=1157962 RepID=A0A250X5G7_9CHLO|nr:hypothetical protein CEUSTIGMA_g5584.t1 [Chlamydomonas eustigma]|eukprot:GAX78142.1 hypothetical protein CEUSTIGMA_g5584.t1 [Chlamydomonas eustigma]